MANPEHLAKLKEGVEAWGNWRRENPSVVPDLSEADLSGANLFAAVNLRGAHLVAAYLSQANLGRVEPQWGGSPLGNQQNIVSGFAALGYRFSAQASSVTNPMRLVWYTPQGVLRFRLWAFLITGGGGGPTVRSADEFRIQITKRSSIVRIVELRFLNRLLLVSVPVVGAIALAGNALVAIEI